MPYKDPAVAKARSDLYRKENREKLRAAAKRRHVDNRDEHLAYLKEYRKNNLEARIDCDLRRVYGITLDEYSFSFRAKEESAPYAASLPSAFVCQWTMTMRPGKYVVCCAISAI
jgi:hypothetical protein